MSRINTVTKETANLEQQALFDAIQAKLGGVPNFLVDNHGILINL